MKRLFHWLRSDKKRAVRLAVIWTALIFVATLIPSSGVPRVNIPMMDKWVHFVIFAGFTILWACTLRSISFLSLMFIFLLSLVTGWLVEVLQGSGITRGRSYEVADIFADGLGGLLGVMIFYILYITTKEHNS